MDNETEDVEGVMEDDIDGVSEGENDAAVAQAASHATRGAILVTLRDKVPYTLW